MGKKMCAGVLAVLAMVAGTPARAGCMMNSLPADPVFDAAGRVDYLAYVQQRVDMMKCLNGEIAQAREMANTEGRRTPPLRNPPRKQQPGPAVTPLTRYDPVAESASGPSLFTPARPVAMMVQFPDPASGEGGTLRLTIDVPRGMAGRLIGVLEQELDGYR